LRWDCGFEKKKQGLTQKRYLIGPFLPRLGGFLPAEKRIKTVALQRIFWYPYRVKWLDYAVWRLIWENRYI
jgi:hypothetical protein